MLLVGDPGGLDGAGVAMALGAALVYSAYILASDTVLPGVDPIGLTTIVCAGAAATFGTAALVSGELSLGFDAIGWLWLVGIAAVSTVLAIVLFFAGLARVGPSRASIISTVEPLVTVLLAFAVFGEALTALQLAGGALVLSSVVLLTASRTPGTSGAGPARPSRPGSTRGPLRTWRRRTRRP